MPSDLRKYAPAVSRNKEAILEVLKRVFPSQGIVLEIASGTGEHASFFSKALSNIQWQPSEYDVEQLDSINAHALFDEAASVRPAAHLDVTIKPWSVEREKFDAILNCNMIHIAPWFVCVDLMAGASRVLNSGGILVTYGPFKRKGVHTSSSNEQFDKTLKIRNMHWGVRDLEKVIKLAEENDLVFEEIVEMPSNNLCVVYRRK